MCFFGPLLINLVAPYCAIPQDYLSDTPLLRAMGFWCLNMANWVRYPLPLFAAFPPWRACEVEVRYPPLKRYLSDTGAIPYENKANGCDTPLCDTISKGYCAIWGSVSHWAAKLITSQSQDLALRGMYAQGHVKEEAPQSTACSVHPQGRKRPSRRTSSLARPKACNRQSLSHRNML